MQSTAGHQSRTVTLLEDCQSLVLKLLQPKLGKLFECSNVAFLEFAEKAQTGSSQIRFMEAMAVVQRDRARIEDEFYRGVGKSFTDFGIPTHPVSTKSRFDDFPLALQSKEDADIEIAIQNMIGSASLGATQTLGALLKRLAVLNHGRKIEEGDLPGGPHCLAHAFHSAIRSMVLDHETRLIVFLLFDKFVLASTRFLFDEYNKLLIQAGILPNLKYEVQRNPASSAPGHTQTPGTAAPRATVEEQKHSLADELLESVLQLISQRNNANGGHPAVTVEPASPLPKQELVTAIQQLQQQRRQDSIAPITCDTSLSAAEQQTHVVKTMLQRISAERERLYMGIDRRRLPIADMQVIDLVGMMFEHLLRDVTLPSIAKAELCRLHTPYLKIAIVDKTMFTDTTHPAHRLLNTLAMAGGRWVTENNPDRGIFPCIRNIVQRIIEDFQDNLDIFTDLLQFLNNNLLALEGKAAAIEERTRQAASGRDKLEQARNCAATAIESLVSGRHVPPELRKVLGDVWLDKLMFIYLRESGTSESPSWKLATRAIETILWSIEPRVSEDARNELINRLPEIRRQIEQALDMLSAFGPSDYKSQLSLIYRLQNKAVAQDSEFSVALDPVVQALQPTEVPVASGFNQPATAHAAAADITTDALPDEAQINLTPHEETALNTLRQAAFGTWFTILMDPDLPPLQVKLSWYSGISGNYMFVNSMGVKALVIKHHELATLLVSGKASIMEQEQQPFVQRTLEMIRRMLGGVHKTGVA